MRRGASRGVRTERTTLQRHGPESNLISRALTDSQKAELAALIHAGIAQRMFPGAVAYVSRDGETLLHEAFGQTVYEREAARPVRLGDRFDLASVTKLFTTAVVLRLVARGVFGLDDLVRDHVPQVAGGWTVADLLAHRTGTTAGLLGHAARCGVRPCEPGQQEKLWEAIFACDAAVELKEGESHYSDIDLLLAQAVCERATGCGLAELMADEVTGPLGLRDTGFCPDDARRCVPTEVDEQWRHRLVVGEVHDEMAYTLGGIAGHAGLFATAADVARFCEAWLGIGDVELVTEATRRLAWRPHSDGFGLGWALCNEHSSFPMLGRYGGVGHLGFTGTWACILPALSLVLVVLTNRVYPHRDAAPPRLPLLRELADRVIAWV